MPVTVLRPSEMVPRVKAKYFQVNSMSASPWMGSRRMMTSSGSAVA